MNASENKSVPSATDPFQAELDAIDLDVSKMVADDPSTWEFTALRRRAEHCCRVQIPPWNEVKCDWCSIASRGSKMLSDATICWNNRVAPASAIASHRPSVLPTMIRTDSTASAKLTPVVSQRPNAPRYALVDNSNQVVSFITPAPGVNLQPYVGKEVGVSGQRGFMPELQKPHVTAMRVNILDDGPMMR